MCTVLYYRYICGHCLARRPSRCGGTRCKTTRSGRKAACTAEGYITIQRETLCNTCLKNDWIARWQGKLDKARRFHKSVLDSGAPGASEVFDLVRELEEKYELESWELKDVIPYGDRARVRRVDPGDGREKKVVGSPLRREVRPEEVVIPVVEEPVYDEDDGWEPSTDPLHPISTNYEVSHPGVDEGLLESFVREDEYEADRVYGEIDSSAAGWSWDEEVVDAKQDHEDRESNVPDFRAFDPGPDPDADQDPARYHKDSTVSRTVASHVQPPDEPHIDGLPAYQETHLEQIEHTIAAFWEAINADSPPTASQPSYQPHGSKYQHAYTCEKDGQRRYHAEGSHCDPQAPRCPQVRACNLASGAQSRPDPATSLTDLNSDTDTHSTLSYSFTDGPSDPLPISPSISQIQTESASSQRSAPSPVKQQVTDYRQAKYDGFRKALLPLKKEDPKQYYGQWLVECRLEIREMVGPDGVRVWDPPRERS